jgi:hypothetical protein
MSCAPFRCPGASSRNGCQCNAWQKALALLARRTKDELHYPIFDDPDPGWMTIPGDRGSPRTGRNEYHPNKLGWYVTVTFRTLEP